MKFRRQRRVWKPTTSFASSPSWIARRISTGSTDQLSVPGHGMCTKCTSARLRPRVPDDARRDVEVVVVEEDRCARIAIELVQDGVGERAG